MRKRGESRACVNGFLLHSLRSSSFRVRGEQSRKDVENCTEVRGKDFVPSKAQQTQKQNYDDPPFLQFSFFFHLFYFPAPFFSVACFALRRTCEAIHSVVVRSCHVGGQFVCCVDTLALVYNHQFMNVTRGWGIVLKGKCCF